MDFIEILGKSKERIATGLALVGGALMVAFLDNFFLTWAVLGVAFILSFHEASKLFEIQNNSIYFFALILWVAAFFYPNPEDLIFLFLIIYTSYMLYVQKLEYKLFYPFLYPTAPFLFLFALYKGFGMGVLVWLILIVAIADTGAYFAGKRFGKTSFSPSSPNKTLEGVLGGLIAATIIGGVFGINFVSLYQAIFVSFAVAFFSIWGDIFESYLKRRVGVKDSGNILPGHGGMLDRVDGYMFGGILMVVLLRGYA